MPVLALVLSLTTAGHSVGQLSGRDVGGYEARFGTPIDVDLEDLAQASAEYEGRAVRTKGRLTVPIGPRAQAYLLRELGAQVAIAPVSEIAFEFQDNASRWVGHEVQVTGVLNTQGGLDRNILSSIRFWAFVGPREKEAESKRRETLEVTLEALVSQPGQRDGQTVRVVGQFRGRNLYGDLPTSSERASDDWVIKDGPYAVWVTGRKAEGSGWRLDPSLKGDTAKWIEVIGRPETRGGVTYLRARAVALTAPPSATAPAQ